MHTWNGGWALFILLHLANINSSKRAKLKEKLFEIQTHSIVQDSEGKCPQMNKSSETIRVVEGSSVR